MEETLQVLNYIVTGKIAGPLSHFTKTINLTQKNKYGYNWKGLLVYL